MGKRRLIAEQLLQQPLDLDIETAATTMEQRGAIFTRPEVVAFMLDLVGYTPDRPLYTQRLLEPSIGAGDMLLLAIDRLISAWRTHQTDGDIAALKPALRGFELHAPTFASTRQRVIARLRGHGFSQDHAVALAEAWLQQGDFLLLPLDGPFHIVVGNPPYVRQEAIPDALMAQYRARYCTIYDRADLYIPFIERSLELLAEGGQLCFICTDRWMKNRYGAPLRALVAQRFHLKIYVDMVDTPAFTTNVATYPAITVIARTQPGNTRVAFRPTMTADVLAELATLLTNQQVPTHSSRVEELEAVVSGSEPWIFAAYDQLGLVRRLEEAFPSLEEAGCKVGIGVATGADDVFIRPYEALDIEPDRKLPLVMTADLVAGQIVWGGLGVINPFQDDGSLVNLGMYPRLQRYLETHKAVIAGRHIAKKMPARWYRTIDRIYPALTTMPKLLIPDIKGSAQIVYDPGHFYPHHNLYYITSQQWDLRALQAVLLSGIAQMFVSAYSTRIRGGYMRFQAQYLRRIRIPHWHAVPDPIKHDLIDVSQRADVEACNQAVYRLYGISDAEQKALDAQRREAIHGTRSRRLRNQGTRSSPDILG